MRIVREVRVAVAVFGQLDHVLRERNLTLADLKRQIEERHELTVDEVALAQLAGNERLAQFDLTVVGAAANVLGVPLDDLLFVLALPFSPERPTTKVNMLTEEETWRVWALFGMQEKRILSDRERQELEAISEEGDRRARELFWRKEAERRGVPFEALEEEIGEDERIVATMKRRPLPDVADPGAKQSESAREQQATAFR